MKEIETQNIEWKESWRDEYLKWICGFANADGGTLFIGKRDDGSIAGLADAKKLMEEIPNKVRDIMGIMVDVNLKEEFGNQYLEIIVESYPNPVSYKGQYHYRSGSTKQELKGAALDRFLLIKQGKNWDNVPVPNLNVEDLSVEAFDNFKKLAKKSQRVDEELLNESNENLIEKLHLYEGHYLIRAAILLFHPDPEKFITGSYVKIGFFRTDTDLIYHDEIHGDLFTQSNKTIDLLITKYLKAAITYEGIHRIEQYPVPYEALREAVLNAIVHRDYAVAAPIQIKVYADKIKIWNPVILPENWNLEKLLGEHSSHPYNPGIANCFFRAGEIESWGRGIQKILLACKESGTPEPALRLSGNDLWVEFPFGEEYLENIGEKKASVGKASEKRRNDFGMISEAIRKEFGRNVEKTFLFIVENKYITASELAEKLDVSSRTVENYIIKLKDADIIERKGPKLGGYWEILEKNNEQKDK